VNDDFVVLYDPRRPSQSLPWCIARDAFVSDEAPVPRSAGIIERDLLERVPDLTSLPAPVRLKGQFLVTLVVLTVTSAGSAYRLTVSLSARRQFAVLEADGKETSGVIRAARMIPDRHADLIRVW